jgi:hypothetical protein
MQAPMYHPENDYWDTKSNQPLESNVFVFRVLCETRDSVVGIVTGYGLDDRGGRNSSPDRVKNFLFSTSSRPALGSTQPPIQWVPGLFSQG